METNEKPKIEYRPHYLGVYQDQRIIKIKGNWATKRELIRNIQLIVRELPNYYEIEFEGKFTASLFGKLYYERIKRFDMMREMMSERTLSI